MNRTKIEWCVNPDGTQGVSWNPIKMRCTPVSEGCANCYARRILSRNLPGFASYPKEGEPPKLDERELEKPIRWKKPRMVFVESMGDLFHEDVIDADISAVLSMSRKAPQHTYMILTKRPNRLAEFMKGWWGNLHINKKGALRDNIWLGVTAENQEQADNRIPVLFQIPAAVRFVSVEPMLSAVDLSDYVWDHDNRDGLSERDALDWVIYGPETGPNKRPFDVQWGLDLQRQCQDAGVPVFAKKLLHPEMVREMPKIN